MQKLIIFKKSYDFTKWLFNHTNKFPKSHRFSVAVRLENGMLEFLRLITVANYRRKKLPLLKAADEELLSLRIFILGEKHNGVDNQNMESATSGSAVYF